MRRNIAEMKKNPINLNLALRGYRVFLKKVLHKRHEKIQEKMHLTWQKDENLVQVQHCSVYFSIIQSCFFFADMAL